MSRVDSLLHRALTQPVMGPQTPEQLSRIATAASSLKSSTSLFLSSQDAVF